MGARGFELGNPDASVVCCLSIDERAMAPRPTPERRRNARREVGSLPNSIEPERLGVFMKKLFDINKLVEIEECPAEFV